MLLNDLLELSNWCDPLWAASFEVCKQEQTSQSLIQCCLLHSRRLKSCLKFHLDVIKQFEKMSLVEIVTCSMSFWVPLTWINHWTKHFPWFEHNCNPWKNVTWRQKLFFFNLNLTLMNWFWMHWHRFLGCCHLCLVHVSFSSLIFCLLS
mgnify:CR=1 FL=1